MVENNETLGGWFNTLVRIRSAGMLGYTSLILIERLVDEVMWISEQYKRRELENELRIKKATNEFMKALEDHDKKIHRDAVEEFVSGAGKVFEAYSNEISVEEFINSVRKSFEDNMEINSNDNVVEDCISGLRKYLEAEVENITAK